MVQRSFASLLKKVEDDLDAVRDEFLRRVAEDLVNSSPVLTGTYVRNHRITTTTGSGGTSSSHGKPKDDGSARTDSLAQLNNQIEALPNDTTTVYIANRSPHANRVEYGGWSGRGPYAVFSGVRDRAKYHLQQAVSIVKGRQ